MTVQEVRERLEYVAYLALGEIEDPSSDVSAHIEEDQLHVDVLRAIAGGSPDARELAEEALRSEGIEFSRRYD